MPDSPEAVCAYTYAYAYTHHTGITVEAELQLRPWFGGELHDASLPLRI